MGDFPSDFPSNFSDGGNTMFSMFSIIVPLIFICVFAIIAFVIISGIKQWSHNNSQPVLTVDAKLIGKRTNISSNMHNSNDNMMNHSSSTTYYVTFEVQSGDRMEFTIIGHEYGLLMEGDYGKLTFQGTRYHKFDRILT